MQNFNSVFESDTFVAAQGPGLPVTREASANQKGLPVTWEGSAIQNVFRAASHLGSFSQSEKAASHLESFSQSEKFVSHPESLSQSEKAASHPGRFSQSECVQGCLESSANQNVTSNIPCLMSEVGLPCLQAEAKAPQRSKVWWIQTKTFKLSNSARQLMTKDISASVK